MFKIEISDGYGGITEELQADTLEEILNDAKAKVLDGTGIEDITVWQEIPLSFTISVEVKAN